jgi:hypothetical protein
MHFFSPESFCPVGNVAAPPLQLLPAAALPIFAAKKHTK